MVTFEIILNICFSFRAAWNDDYLKWTPSEHNNTFVISMEAWKIWQPTFALYNSARSNSWFVYMSGV